jgi:hypothetical protein
MENRHAEVDVRFLYVSPPFGGKALRGVDVLERNGEMD